MNNDGPKKDIVYIDVDDDVTSVIGKVRGSNEKIVALVPPKNIGALQSAVNLRLLQRAADNAGKRIVLITNNSGLTALAAGIKVPVAKNLQSKPEIPSAPEAPEDTDEDVIKGEDLPVGELAAATTAAMAVEANPADLKPSDDDIVVGDLPDLDKDVPAAAVIAGGSGKSKGKGPRVPNFNRFRKLIFIGGALIVAVILFFVLGNIFWTGANVVITAKTTDLPIDSSLTITTTGQTDPNTNVIQAVTKSTKTTQTVNFTATGQQNNGNKATGSVKYSNSSANAATIAAGTQLTTSGGLVFVTDSAVTVPGATLSFGCSGYVCPGSASGTITASAGGASYNGATGSLDGAPSSVTATLSDATTGGTDNIVTVVSDSDIAKAKSQLSSDSGDAASAKAQLAQQFGSDYVVITDSFASSPGNPTSSPASGQQASTAKLSQDTSYTMLAIPKSQIKVIADNYLSGQINANANQKIYDDGENNASLSQFLTSPGGTQSVELKATGKIGPNIDETALKNQIAGQKSGQIMQEIEGINGVKNVTVSITPFWHDTAPAANKIKISFTLSDGS